MAGEGKTLFDVGKLACHFTDETRSDVLRALGPVLIEGIEKVVSGGEDRVDIDPRSPGLHGHKVAISVETGRCPPAIFVSVDGRVACQYTYSSPEFARRASPEVVLQAYEP